MFPNPSHPTFNIFPPTFQRSTARTPAVPPIALLQAVLGHFVRARSTNLVVDVEQALDIVIACEWVGEQADEKQCVLDGLAGCAIQSVNDAEKINDTDRPT